MTDLITYTLPNFPVVDQRHEPTSDRQPDENPDWNCVPASLSAGARYLLPGKSADEINGDSLKDAVYGQGYTGAQAARDYIPYFAKIGITLEAFDSRDQNALVARIHAELRAGHPVIITMPSQWGIPPVDPLHPIRSTHVGCACGYGPAAIRVMNPWGGFWHDGTDEYWRARLCYGEIWVMRLTHEGETHMGIPTGWKDDGTTLTAPNGQTVHLGFRGYILQQSWPADEQPRAPERATNSVMEQDGRWGKGALQDFATIRLFAASAPDPAVTGGVHKEWVIGRVPLLEELAAVTQQRDNEHGIAESLDTKLVAVTHDLGTAEDQIKAANTEIATLKEQLANTPQLGPIELAAIKVGYAIKGLEAAQDPSPTK